MFKKVFLSNDLKDKLFGNSFLKSILSELYFCVAHHGLICLQNPLVAVMLKRKL